MCSVISSHFVVIFCCLQGVSVLFVHYEFTNTCDGKNQLLSSANLWQLTINSS